MRTLAFIAALALLAEGGLEAQATRPPARPATARPVRLTPAPTGNEARFVVNEQLAGVELPNDAVGVTSAITGGLTIDGAGKVDSSGSRFVVDLTTLKSDRDRRDNFIKRRTIVTDSFPKAEFVITGLSGLSGAVPTSGTMNLVLTGHLTIHGVTKPSRWEVTATATESGVSGKAVTNFQFADFNMTKPRLAVVLSVKDDIRLEYDFNLVRGSP